MRLSTFCLRAALGPALALLAGGCTPDGVGPAASLESTVQPRADVMALAPDRVAAPGRPAGAPAPARPRMVALPAEAGAVGPVRTRDYADGFRQDVALAGAKVPLVSNGITLLAVTGGETLDERVPMHQPTEAMVRSEIGAALPHVSMQIVESERSNEYGPYGLALGRVGADTRCLYMWQWIDRVRLPRDVGMAGPASVRVRLCRTGSSFDEMAGWVDKLRLGPQAAPDSPQVAAADRILPPDEQIEPAKPAHRSAPKRRRVAHHQSRKVPAARVARSEPAPESTGPRYLTADTASASSVRAIAPVTAPVATAAPAQKFGGDLPPEAFAGPRSTSSASPRP